MKRVWLLIAILLLSGCTTLVSGDTLSGDGQAEIESLNTTELEHELHRLVNEERAERGLQTLAYNPELRQVARYHSEDMAENSYFRHTAPDGETLEQRYEQFNIDCPGQHIAGENIGTGYANAKVAYEGETLEIGTNETRIAKLLVQQWMDSPAHRENIVGSQWVSEGIGVATVDKNGRTKLYVTQNFC